MSTSYRIGQISISKGNAKLDKSICIFSIPAVKTCPNCKDCAKACYARKEKESIRRCCLVVNPIGLHPNCLVLLTVWSRSSGLPR